MNDASIEHVLSSVRFHAARNRREQREIAEFWCEEDAVVLVSDGLVHASPCRAVEPMDATEMIKLSRAEPHRQRVSRYR